MRFVSVALLAVLAVGCPTNDAPPTDGAPGAAGGVPPNGDPNAQPGPGGQPGPAPGDATAPPPSGDASGPPTGLMGPPGFASLITDGATVTITGTVTGAAKGDTVQVDFTRLRDNNGEKAPEALEVVKTTDGKFSITAPAKLDGEIYVTAAILDDKGAPGKKGGASASPVKLEGKDVTVTVAISDSADWQKKLPWFSANMPAPASPGDAPAPGTPPGGGTPGSGAPPGGAAPPLPAPDATGPAAGGPPPGPPAPPVGGPG